VREIKKIIVHQTGTPTGTLEDIRRYHMEALGWRDIGYHYLVTQDGSIHKGRHNAEVGAHCAGDNADSLGVCLVGAGNAFPLNGHKGYMTLAMFAALLGLLLDLRFAYPKACEQVYGHREMTSGIRQGKTCPGFNVSILREIL